MQQLLTGKKRINKFKNYRLVSKCLKELLVPVTRPTPKPVTKFLALGIRSHGKGTFLKPDFDPKTIDMDTLYKVKENDLIVNITFAWEGAIAIANSKDAGALVSHRFPIYISNPETSNIDFLRYIIIQPRFTYYLSLISPGEAGRNRVLSKSDFLELSIKVPKLPEQIEIGRILRKVDEEITSLKQKLEEYKTQKKGLMQLLLTGKKRIKLN